MCNQSKAFKPAARWYQREAVYGHQPHQNQEPRSPLDGSEIRNNNQENPVMETESKKQKCYNHGKWYMLHPKMKIAD